MPLSFHERDRRYNAIRTWMKEREFSLLVVASNAMWTGHVRYFSDYPPHFGYAYVVFPVEGDPTLFVFSKIQEQIASQRWIKDSRQASNYPDSLVRRIKQVDYRNKRIGLVGVENISFKIYEHLKKELPSSTFADATQDIFNLRMVKSSEEQTFIRNCAHIADTLYSRVKEVARVGASEFDIFADMEYFMRKQRVENAFNLIASGRFPIAPFISPSEKILGPEDSILVELTPRYEGFYTQLTIVIPLGEPDTRMKGFLDIAFAAQKAGLNLLKPGNRASDVAKAMKDVVEEAGYTLPYRGGHSMGHDLDEPPAITIEDTTVLKPGMTIVIHPCVMDKNGEGVFIGDSYIINETGWERLNNAFVDLQ